MVVGARGPFHEKRRVRGALKSKRFFGDVFFLHFFFSIKIYRTRLVTLFHTHTRHRCTLPQQHAHSLRVFPTSRQAPSALPTARPLLIRLPCIRAGPQVLVAFDSTNIIPNTYRSENERFAQFSCAHESHMISPSPSLLGPCLRRSHTQTHEPAYPRDYCCCTSV